MRAKGHKVLLYLNLTLFFLPRLAHSGFNLLGGSTFGAGAVEPSSRFLSAIGGGRRDGDEDIDRGETVYRDLPSSFMAATAGIMVGTKIYFLGADARLRGILGPGVPATRYNRNEIGELSYQRGHFNYISLNWDIGLRIYPVSFLFLRPYAGLMTGHRFAFSFFKNHPIVHGSYSENSPRFKKGIGVSFIIETNETYLEIGFDFSRYSSSFGGYTNEYMILLTPANFW